MLEDPDPDSKELKAGDTNYFRLEPRSQPLSVPEALIWSSPPDNHRAWTSQEFSDGLGNREDVESVVGGSPHLGNQKSLQTREDRILHLVLFKCSRAEVFYIPDNTELFVNPGDFVVVEADRGIDLGRIARSDIDWVSIAELKKHYAEEHYKWLIYCYCSQSAGTDGDVAGAVMLAATNELQGGAVGGMGPASRYSLEMPQIGMGELQPKRIMRLAHTHEIQELRNKELEEKKAKDICTQKVKEYGLAMEILDAEFQMDWKKITFYYFAKTYINFEDLVMDLFKIYKTRIWMSAINPASFTSPSGTHQTYGAPGVVGPGAVTSLIRPSTVDLEYAASDISGDGSSIFSLPDSLSSKSSMQTSPGPTEEFVALLIKQTDLPAKYSALSEAFEFTTFKTEVHRLLKDFSKDLAKEASIPIERESVRFIGQQRRRISYSLSQEVFGLKDQTLFGQGVSSQKQEQDRKERIEQFLRDATQAKGGSAEAQEPTKQKLEDDSSDDDEELGTLSSLEQVKQFLIKSKAFNQLSLNLGQLGQHLQYITVKRDSALSYLKKTESEGDLHTHMESLNDGIDERQETSISDHERELESKEKIAISDLPQLPHVNEEREEQVVESHEDVVYKPGVVQLTHKYFSRWLRPRLKRGHRRLEWYCDCGALLYGDFTAHNPGDIDKLAEEIGATGSDIRPNIVEGLKSVPAAQGHSSPTNRGVSATQSSNAPSIQAPSANPMMRMTAARPPNPGFSTAVQVQLLPTSQVTMTKKFTALCVNTGKFHKTLGEIDVSGVTTDRQIFHQFKQSYYSLRGFRARSLRWFLIEPVDIKFVQFSLEDSNRVDIIPQPPDCTFCASETDVRSRGYEPHFKTVTRTHPPISANAFLHYWQCNVKEPSLSKTKWLNRLSKKLDKKLQDVRRATPIEEDVLGWGIHIVEGINMAFVTFLTFLVLLFSGAVSVWFSIWRGDVSGGFAIGAYIVSTWAAFLTALYFQWVRE